MIVPADIQLYSGASLLREMSPEVRADHLKEFRSAAPQLRNEYKLFQAPTGSGASVEEAYLLGLSVARAIILANPRIEKPGDVL